jgi:hypothetical protein
MPKARILQPTYIDIEYQPGKMGQVTFCGKRIVRAGKAPLETIRPHLHELLRWRSRVPDAWRYSFAIANGRVGGDWETASGAVKIARSDFPFDSDMANYDGGRNIVLLILESPHVSEYSMHGNPPSLRPKAPAQGRAPGDAGGGIERFGLDVLDFLVQEHTQRMGKALADGLYSLVLVNPVPYMTSLHWMDVLTGHAEEPSGNLRHSLRDHVWTQLWSLATTQADFISRCKRYSPAAILNCCTANLKDRVTDSLRDAGFASITYSAFHPAYNWNSKRPIVVKPV